MEARYVRKVSDTACSICVETIDFYAIGDCGHNLVCWKCSLKQRMKLSKKECAICKQINHKVLITKNKYDSLDTCQSAICDIENELTFENLFVRNEIMKMIGLYCQLCPTDNARKFPTMDAISRHLESFHKQVYCDKCIEFKPVLLFEQRPYQFN